MKKLAGIFYLLAFVGIMAVAHFIPTNPPLPAKPAAEPAPPVVEPIPVEEVVETALNSRLKKTKAELGKLQNVISENAKQMTELNQKFNQISDTNASLKQENTLLAKRLAKVEARPVAIEEPVEIKPEPAEAAPDPDPEEKPDPPRPTPRRKSIEFTLSSMDFSLAALETLKKAADEMALNDKLLIALRGSTTGFGTSLGKGRAEAVKSKLAEFGVDADRVSISDEQQTGSDAVQLNFSKKRKTDATP